ncbi:hypothetical protein LC574_09810 [Nostoc sp. CHAB 5715]|nr:hypothetical protein [Nostoc sp. CHAB 5715]
MKGAYMGSLTEGLNFDKQMDKKSGKSSKDAGKGKGKGSTSNQGVKIGIIVACFLVAGVMLLQQAGVINLFGSDAPPPNKTPQEQAAEQKEYEKARIRDEAALKQAESLPPSQRPVIVGGN